MISDGVYVVMLDSYGVDVDPWDECSGHRAQMHGNLL